MAGIDVRQDVLDQAARFLSIHLHRLPGTSPDMAAFALYAPLPAFRTPRASSAQWLMPPS